MKKLFKLPHSRVYALAAETNTAPDVAIASLLSTLYAAKCGYITARASQRKTKQFLFTARMCPHQRGAHKAEPLSLASVPELVSVSTLRASAASDTAAPVKGQHEKKKGLRNYESDS